MNQPASHRPVSYSGIKFQNRLSAKYAVLFDNLDIEWIYRPIFIRDGSDSFGFDFHIQFADKNKHALVVIKPSNPFSSEIQHVLSGIGTVHDMFGVVVDPHTHTADIMFLYGSFQGSLNASRIEHSLGGRINEVQMPLINFLQSGKHLMVSQFDTAVESVNNFRI